MDAIPQMPDFGPFQTADLINNFWVVRDMTPAELTAAFPPAPHPVPTAAETLAAWREQANLTRTAFCIACKRMGILPPAEAVAAARGDWPATFADALTGLPVDAEEAQIVWAAATHIWRTDPVLGVVAQHAGMTPGQVDAMFGWTG